MWYKLLLYCLGNNDPKKTIFSADAIFRIYNHWMERDDWCVKAIIIIILLNEKSRQAALFSSLNTVIYYLIIFI